MDLKDATLMFLAEAAACPAVAVVSASGDWVAGVPGSALLARL